jgi:hypothetical protein
MVSDGLVLVSRRSTQHKTSTATPKTMKAQKLARQPSSSSSIPPNIGPSMGATAHAVAT